MTAKLNKYWACVIVASFVAVAGSSGTKADELAAHPGDQTCLQSECDHVAVGEAGTVPLKKDAEIGLQRPYRTVRVEDPNIVDVSPINDQTIRIKPKLFGHTHVMFYDHKGDLIQAIDVSLVHPVEIVWPGQSPGAGTSTYECWATGCDFKKQSHYERPTQNINYTINTNAPAAPRQ